MLKLKLQYFGHLMRRADSFEKTLMLGKIKGGRRRGQQRMRWLHHWLTGPEFGWTPGVGDGQEGLACCISWGRKYSDTTEWLNWNELNTTKANLCSSMILNYELDSDWDLLLDIYMPFQLHMLCHFKHLITCNHINLHDKLIVNSVIIIKIFLILF